MSAQSQPIQLIALNRLVASPRNVRRQDRKADIDALAASIAAHGLLQNLCVARNENDKYEVDAGGRRLAALKQLAKQGVIPKDHPIPCNVVAVEQGVEISLAENVQRVAMDAIDEVEAYAALVAEGATPEEVARVRKSYTGQALRPLLNGHAANGNSHATNKSKEPKAIVANARTLDPVPMNAASSAVAASALRAGFATANANGMDA